MYLFFSFSFVIFVMGSFGMFLSSKHMMIALISLEVMLLAVNFNFVMYSMFFDDFLGQIFALMVLTLAAAESAIGLAILVVYYSLSGGISIDFVNLLKG